ncbi:putative serine/threonine-protein kinase PBL26 [Zea mays]|uniref:Putative serine/threonine-protein kinase PBL26 n=1 Tax=Zea mays TaxID=4577 RepID=A0A3L6E8B6_MAIZE|nr:putative serine/threonine-protein kinase PBL26 [Zea mays]
MDVQFGDPNGNHVGLDLGSMVSAAAADLGGDDAGVDLASGRTINAWIDYRPSSSPSGSAAGILEVFVSYAPKQPPRPVLSAPLDLAEAVKDAAFVGFSASTQGSTEVHAIEWWSFSTASPAPSPRSAAPAPESPALPPPVATPVLPSPLLPGGTTTAPAPPAGSAGAPAASIAPSSGATVGRNAAGSGTPRPPAAVAGAATAGAFVAASFAGVALWALARRARARKRQAALAVGTKRDSSVASAAALARSPRDPEPALRPGMRAVVQVLGGEADPPFVPAARPSMSLGSANQQLLLSLQDSVSDYHAMLGLPLSDSSSSGSLSSSSLTSTLRRGGHDIRVNSTAGEASTTRPADRSVRSRERGRGLPTARAERGREEIQGSGTYSWEKMSCFGCFKPDKKVPPRRTESREVTVVNKAPSQNEAPPRESGSIRPPPVASKHKHRPSSETAASIEPPKGSCSVAKTAKAFTFRELATATKNFRSDCLLGEGGFGRVYKGRLENGQLVAVKQLDLNGYQGNREFLVEMEIKGFWFMSTWHLAHLQITCLVKPMLRDRKRYNELVDPHLRGEYPEKDLSQAVGVAAMCLQEEASVRPYMSDAVVALGFLAEMPAGYKHKSGPILQMKQVGDPSRTGSTKQDKDAYNRQKAVAEAIEWGSLRQKQKAQNPEKKALSQGISPPEASRL